MRESGVAGWTTDDDDDDMQDEHQKNNDTKEAHAHKNPSRPLMRQHRSSRRMSRLRRHRRRRQLALSIPIPLEGRRGDGRRQRRACSRQHRRHLLAPIPTAVLRRRLYGRWDSERRVPASGTAASTAGTTCRSRIWLAAVALGMRGVVHKVHGGGW